MFFTQQGHTTTILKSFFLSLSQDLFASKVAAVQDEHADASMNNVTGANAINIYVGIGVGWSIAAIYHSVNGTVFEVKSES